LQLVLHRLFAVLLLVLDELMCEFSDVKFDDIKDLPALGYRGIKLFNNFSYSLLVSMLKRRSITDFVTLGASPNA